jgi:hypothetical protein
MRKFVVISVNENPEYLFYVPLTIMAWKKLGWDVILIRTCQQSKLFELATKNFYPQTEVILWDHKYPSVMVAQVSRLYAAISKRSDDYIMTSDVDMLPLSDYWKFDPEKITVWGHDLTGFNHMPICYIGMKASRWIEVMGITSDNYNEQINRDLDAMPNASSEYASKRWCVDQDLITERINSAQFQKEFVYRGVYSNGYPIGRVDRSSWSKDHSFFIDAHLPRGIYMGGEEFAKINILLNCIWPNEDMTWFYKYTEEFAKLVK